MSKQNNVIKFPVGKKQQKSNNSKKVSFDLENKKIMISASMVSFLFLVSLINSSILSTSKTKSYDNSRGIASINGLNRNTTWEYALAKELAERPVRRGLASLGSAPSKEEQLVIGLLQNQYQVKYANGYIKEVQFDSQQDGMQPKEVNPEQFISDFRDIFPFEFTQAQKRESSTKEGKQFKRYALLDNTAKNRAELLFEFDQQGRMLSLKVESKTVN